MVDGSTTSTSIAQLISLTLGLVGASGCGDRTTSTDSGIAEESGSASESDTDAETETGSGTGATSTSDTNDNTDSDDLPPCPEPTVSDVEVTDWAVTDEAFVQIQAAATLYGGAPWEMRDAYEHCEIACAYASNNLYAIAKDYYYRLELDTCELSIPAEGNDGLLNCAGVLIEAEFCGGGRAPLAWTPEFHAKRSVSDQLDAMAVMEAVSITAFEELAAQLEQLAAPTELVSRCRSAARDEARHLALLEQLGGHGPTQLPAPASRSSAPLTIALHNAVEGCVNETWAALLAQHQSQHAASPELREAFAQIAHDETRHAQLAWDLHHWLCRLLSPEQANQVEQARQQALRGLERAALQQALALPIAVREQLGLPAPRRAAALAREFGTQLRAAA